MNNLIEKELYEVGDDVVMKANFSDGPDYIGTVRKVDSAVGHGYYYVVDYIDQSGRPMQCGCANKHIRGRLPRVEKVIGGNAGEDDIEQARRLIG